MGYFGGFEPREGALALTMALGGLRRSRILSTTERSRGARLSAAGRSGDRRAMASRPAR